MAAALALPAPASQAPVVLVVLRLLQGAGGEAGRGVGGQPDNAPVYATIRRRAIDLGRRSQRREAREQASEPPQFVITNPDDEDATRLLEKELKRLPPQQREVLTLKFWGGLTFAEVAATLEIPQGTAASRYRMALESLRQTLTTMLT